MLSGESSPSIASALATRPVDQMRRLMEATFEGAILHASGVILDANRAAAALFGRAVPELNRCPISELLREQSCRVLMRQIHARSNAPCPVTGVRKDGSCVTVELTVKATLTCEGRRVEVLTVR
jgi:PAS domain S-box-containing protein